MSSAPWQTVQRIFPEYLKNPQLFRNSEQRRRQQLSVRFLFCFHAHSSRATWRKRERSPSQSTKRAAFLLGASEVPGRPGRSIKIYRRAASGIPRECRAPFSAARRARLLFFSLARAARKESQARISSAIAQAP